MLPHTELRLLQMEEAFTSINVECSDQIEIKVAYRWLWSGTTYCTGENG